MSGDGGASSREFPKPVLVVSRCLGFDACRWDGGKIPFPFLDRLKPYVEFRPVCPEMEIGLGAPRDPIRIHLEGGRKILQQPRTGRRLTRVMNAFSGRFLAGLEQADGFILKRGLPPAPSRTRKSSPPRLRKTLSAKAPVCSRRKSSGSSARPPPRTR